MARPNPSALVERLYARLPEHYRNADEEQAEGPSGYPLLRYLSLIGDQAGDVDVLVDRFDYVPTFDGGAPGDTSDLVDPAVADAGWLEWLAQLVGVTLNPSLSTAEKRDEVGDASSGWQAATKSSLAAAAQSVLTGSKQVRVYDHATGITANAVDPGGEWDVLVVTKTSETPDVTEVERVIVAKGAKPAGVELHFDVYEATWGQVENDYPTWADWEAAGSWAAIEEADVA